MPDMPTGTLVRLYRIERRMSTVSLATHAGITVNSSHVAEFGRRAAPPEANSSVVELGALSASTRPNITLRLLPVAAAAHPGLDGAFNVLEFPDPDDGRIVWVEATTNGPACAHGEWGRSHEVGPWRCGSCWVAEYHIGFYTSPMALSIKSDEADRLARELAAETGESLTEAIVIALQERLAREYARRGPQMSVRLRRLQSYAATLPVLDPRAPDEILGYDDNGLPA